MTVSERKKAIDAVNKLGATLVFPLDNRPDPPSLWSVLHPRSKMRWAWDNGADNRVAQLWLLREEMSRRDEVVYGKWFRGRATFFSRKTFTALLAAFETPRRAARTPDANTVYRSLDETSPQSTKELKRSTELAGKFFATTYDKALKSLWEEGRIVGRGEKDDGAFPSLLVGATPASFEELWSEAAKHDRSWGEAQLRKQLPGESPFLKFYEALRKKELRQSA